LSTASSFTQRLHISDVIAPTQSVGAHIAAKLELFQTDERTLTDELCDMLCIWLGLQERRSRHSSKDFTLTLSKTTSAQEVKNGADLELIVSSPLGNKRCLIQAKVLDPLTGKLRCNSTAGWAKLRKQLVAARKEVADLAFLLVYVPGSLLDGEQFGYSTYEQNHRFVSAGKIEAFFGVTMIPVNDLLQKSGRWKKRKQKVPEIAPGQFEFGIPFWQFLLELLLCRRSSWTAGPSLDIERSNYPAFRTLVVGASEVDRDVWMSIQRSADQWLRRDEQ